MQQRWIPEPIWFSAVWWYCGTAGFCGGWQTATFLQWWTLHCACQSQSYQRFPIFSQSEERLFGWLRNHSVISTSKLQTSKTSFFVFNLYLYNGFNGAYRWTIVAHFARLIDSGMLTAELWPCGQFTASHPSWSHQDSQLWRIVALKWHETVGPGVVSNMLKSSFTTIYGTIDLGRFWDLLSLFFTSGQWWVHFVQMQQDFSDRVLHLSSDTDVTWFSYSSCKSGRSSISSKPWASMYIQCNTIVINNMITCSCSHKSLFLDSFIYQCLDINIYIYTVYICLFNFIYLISCTGSM